MPSGENFAEYLVSPTIPKGATCTICDQCSDSDSFLWNNCKCFGGKSKFESKVKLPLNDQLNRFVKEVFVPMLINEIQRVNEKSLKRINLITTPRHAQFDDGSIFRMGGKNSDDACTTRDLKKIICLPIFPLIMPKKEFDFTRMGHHVFQILQILKQELPKSIVQIHCFQSSHISMTYSWLNGAALFDYHNRKESKKWFFVDRYHDPALKYDDGSTLGKKSEGFHAIPCPIPANFDRIFETEAN